MSSPRLHEQGAAPAEVQAEPEDKLAALKASSKDMVAISGQVRELWKKNEEIRSKIIALASDETLPTNVLLGLGIVLAEKNQREAIASLLQAASSPRLEPQEQRSLMFRFVLAVFHAKSSILPALDDAMSATTKNAQGFGQLLEFVPRLVEQGGREDIDRFDAIERLAKLWKFRAELAAPGVFASLNRQLESLTQGVHSDASPEGWTLWLDGFRKPDTKSQSLSMEDIYHDRLNDVNATLSRLVIERRREVAQLISRLRIAGEVPVEFVLKKDAVIRQLAVASIRTAANDFDETVLNEALDQLTKALEDIQLVSTSGVFCDVLSAAGHLAAASEDPVLKQTLASRIFGERWVTEPKVASTRLEVVLRIGILADTKAAAHAYQVAMAPSRVSDKQWVEVRSMAVEAVAVQSENLDVAGIDFILSALEDPASRVRGIAASTCGLLKGKFHLESANPLSALFKRAKSEEDAVTRRRILEAARQIGAEQPEFLLPELGPDLVATYGEKDLETKRAVVQLSVQLLVENGLRSETRAALLGVLKKALAENGGSPLSGQTALEMAVHYCPSMRALLREWVRKLKSPTPPWAEVKKALLADTPDDLEMAWEIANDSASHLDPSWSEEAALIGVLVVDKTRAIVDEKNAWRLRLGELEDKLVIWRENSQSLSEHQKALSTLRARLERKPNDVKILLRMARLEARHANVDDPAVGTDFLVAAQLHFRQVLGEKAVGLTEAEAPGIERELMFLLFQARRWDAAIKSYENLRAGKRQQDGDRLMAARSIVLSPSFEPGRVAKILDEVSVAGQAQLKTELALLRVALSLFQAETLDLGLARQQLDALKNLGGATAASLLKRLETLESLTENRQKLAKALAEGDKASQKALRGEVLAGGEAAILVLLAKLYDSKDANNGAREDFALATRLLAKDATWQKLAWPKAGDATAWQGLVGKIKAWSAARPLGSAAAKLLLTCFWQRLEG